jgi:hypothetical protein
MTDPIPLLMRAQMKAEFELAHGWPPFITDHDPPYDVPKTYLCSCINRDGNIYVACHYWFHEWNTGPFIRVLGWCHLPPALSND